MFKKNCRRTFSSGIKVILIALSIKKLDFLQRIGLKRKARRLVQICLSRKKQQSQQITFLSPECFKLDKSVLNTLFSPHSEMLMDDTCKAKQKVLGKGVKILQYA